MTIRRGAKRDVWAGPQRRAPPPGRPLLALALLASLAPPAPFGAADAAELLDADAPIGAGPADGALPLPTRVLTPIQGPLTLDGRYLGELSGAVDPQGGGVVDARAFLDLVKPVVTPRQLAALQARIGGQDRAPMEDLKTDDLSLEFDTLALGFVLKLGLGARARQDLSLAIQDAVNPASFDPPARLAAGANITLGQGFDHQDSRFRPLTGSTQIMAKYGGFDGVALTGGFTYDGGAPERWRREEWRLSKDLFDSAIRLTAGEFAPGVQGFQGSGRILGVSVARAYGAIRPFQNIRPSGRRQFVLERPSFVEVEVNGVIVQRLQLEPGPYSLADFPFGRGANNIRLLIEDSTGRREIAEFDIFNEATLLDKGVLDFGVSAGVLDESGDFDYRSRAAFSSFVQKGVLDDLTLGANAQWVDKLGAQVGASAIFASRIGLVQGQVSASRSLELDKTGYAAAVDYLKEFSVRERDDLRLALSGQMTTRYFQDAFALFPSNPEIWRATGQIVFRVARLSSTLGASYSKGREGAPDVRSLDLTLGQTFRRIAVTVSMGVRELDPGERETRFGLGLTRVLGRRWNAHARYESRTQLTEVGLARSSSGELGDVSGEVRLSRDQGQQAVTGNLRYINNRFDGELAYNRIVAEGPAGPSTQESFWRASTFVGVADGLVGIGRPAREGFVIAARHATLHGARLALTDSTGRKIATDGMFGPAVMGVDRAYGVTRAEVQVDPLPPGYDLGVGLVNAFPGFADGYRVIVGSDASRTVMGVLSGPEGPIALVAGTIEPVEARKGAPAAPKPFFTNRGGRFIGEGLAPGAYRLVVDGKELARFQIRPDQEGVIDVGRLEAAAP